VYHADDDFYDKSRVTRQILNTLWGKRVISKAECSFMLLDLPLTLFTESFDRISVTAYQKIYSTSRRSESDINKPDSEVSKNKHIHLYRTRDANLQHFSFNQHFHHVRSQILQKSINSEKSEVVLNSLIQPPRLQVHIPVPVGLGANAVYPVDKHTGLNYARTTLIWYKGLSKGTLEQT
jgi:hypothetical protein